MDWNPQIPQADREFITKTAHFWNADENGSLSLYRNNATLTKAGVDPHYQPSSTFIGVIPKRKIQHLKVFVIDNNVKLSPSFNNNHDFLNSLTIAKLKPLLSDHNWQDVKGKMRMTLPIQDINDYVKVSGLKYNDLRLYFTFRSVSTDSRTFTLKKNSPLYDDLYNIIVGSRVQPALDVESPDTFKSK